MAIVSELDVHNTAFVVQMGLFAYKCFLGHLVFRTMPVLSRGWWSLDEDLVFFIMVAYVDNILMHTNDLNQNLDRY